MKLIKSIILILIILSSIRLVAQENSLNGWITIDVNKEVKNWDFGGELELRSLGMFEKTQRLSFQLAASYKIIKGIEAGASYMVMSFYDDKYENYQLRNRYSLLLTGKKKINRFSFNLREKAELTTKDESKRIRENGQIDTYRINPEMLWRNRLRISYNIPGIPLQPGLAAETFYLLNDPDGNTFEKIRYTFWVEYKITDHHTFELYSHFNRELLEDSDDSYIIGLGYALTL